MKTIHIDVTQLVRWQGKLTGIPRVMYELSIRFKDEPNVKFVMWGEDNKALLPIEPEVFISRSSEQQASAEAVGKASLSKRVARKAIPARARVKLKQLRASGEQTVQGGSKATINSGDTLFVLWGEWGSQAYIDSLVGLKSAGVKLIQIAYDMLPIITPQYSGHSTENLTNYMKTLYPLCDLVLAISKNTKQDVEKWLLENGLKAPKTEVFRLGDDFAFASPKQPGGKLFSGKKGYILVVGTVEARKNHTLLYYVYKLAKQRGIELPKIVVVGRRGWLTDDIYELINKDPETKSEFLFLHDASDEELSWLYENCMFSIYPSLYEGWGLPIAESLSRGVPCVASNTSSMTEISDKGLLFFTPTSTDECLDAISKLLNKAELLKLKKAANEYTPATWDNSFKSVKQSIEEAR